MATLNKETLLDWYHKMVLIRRFEERCAELYQQGLIGGFELCGGLGGSD